MKTYVLITVLIVGSNVLTADALTGIETAAAYTAIASAIAAALSALSLLLNGGEDTIVIGIGNYFKDANLYRDGGSYVHEGTEMKAPDIKIPQSGAAGAGAFKDSWYFGGVGGVVRYYVTDEGTKYCIDIMFSIDAVEDYFGNDKKGQGIAIGTDLCDQTKKDTYEKFFAHELGLYSYISPSELPSNTRGGVQEISITDGLAVHDKDNKITVHSDLSGDSTATMDVRIGVYNHHKQNVTPVIPVQWTILLIAFTVFAITFNLYHCFPQKISKHVDIVS
eukprot:248182_1